MSDSSEKKKIENFLAGELDPAFYSRAKIILENIAVKPGERVLEVGCGRGFYEKAVTKIYRGVKIVGVDQNEKYLKMAKQEMGKGAVFLCGNAENLPLGNESFQWVICSEVLEHIRDDEKAISEIKRVLTPGGKVMVSVPHKNYPWQLDPINWVLEKMTGKHIWASMWWLAGIWADHVRLYEEEELLNKFKGHGFKIIKEWRVGGKSIPGWHFLLYGIGKNLVDRGWFRAFDRFNYSASDQKIRKLIARWIRKQTNDHEPVPKNNPFVNIVLLAQKI